MLAAIACAKDESRHEVRRWQDLVGECVQRAPGCYASVTWSDSRRTVLCVQTPDHQTNGQAGPPMPAPYGEAVVVRTTRQRTADHGSPMVQPGADIHFPRFITNLLLSSAELAVHSNGADAEQWATLKRNIEARRHEIEVLLGQSMLLLDLELQSSRLMMVLDLLSAPTVLLDEDVTVRFFNSAARKLFVQKRHVSLSSQNQIALPDAAKNREFRHHVKTLAASPAKDQSPVFLRYQSMDADALDFVRLSPVPSIAIATEHHPKMLTGSVKAEFFVSQAAALVSTKSIQDLFGATPSEAKLAQALCHGLTIDSYAEREGLAKSTVRWHLHNLLMRTETRSQAELIRLLLTVLR
jgi:DNA-binding CsgD family transcriptional regulator